MLFAKKMIVGILIVSAFIFYILLMMKSILFLLVPLCLLVAYAIGDSIFEKDKEEGE